MAGIRIAVRRIRSGNILLSAHQPASNRYVAFAQRVIARYTSGHSLLSPVETILHPHLATLAITIHRHSELMIMPRIAPVIFRWHPRHDHPDPAAPLQPILTLRQEFITYPRGSEARPGFLVAGAGQVAYRLMTYHMRVEAGAVDRRQAERALAIGHSLGSPANGQLAALPDDAGAVLPVTRIVRRLSGKTVDSVEQFAPSGGGRDRPDGVRAGERIGQQMPKDPAVNISHLTDQVVQLIDRRIISQRERLGRF